MLTGLKVLSLKGGYRITDHGLLYLTRLTCLEKLCIRAMNSDKFGPEVGIDRREEELFLETQPEVQRSWLYNNCL